MPHDWINVHVDGDADARTVVKQCARCRLLAVVHESGTRAAIDYHPQHIRAPQDCPRGDMTEERASETAALRADLTAAIARAEAAEKERDRMRPVVSAAVAEYRAADAANDETEPDDTQVQRNGRWAKAETTLHIAVHNYLVHETFDEREQAIRADERAKVEREVVAYLYEQAPHWRDDDGESALMHAREVIAAFSSANVSLGLSAQDVAQRARKPTAGEHRPKPGQPKEGE